MSQLGTHMKWIDERYITGMTLTEHQGYSHFLSIRHVKPGPFIERTKPVLFCVEIMG